MGNHNVISKFFGCVTYNLDGSFFFDIEYKFILIFLPVTFMFENIEKSSSRDPWWKYATVIQNIIYFKI